MEGKAMEVGHLLMKYIGKASGVNHFMRGLLPRPERRATVSLHIPPRSPAHSVSLRLLLQNPRIYGALSYLKAFSEEAGG